MLLKSVALISVLAVISQSVPAPVKGLPFVDSSLPVKFQNNEAASNVSSNLISYAFAVDVSGSIRLDTLQSFKKDGNSAVFVSAYDPSFSGAFDKRACDTIENAYKAGLATEIYMIPQPRSTKYGYQQLDEIYLGLLQVGITVRSIWIRVMSPPDWPSNFNSYNVHFINSIIARARQYGMIVGIFTTADDWSDITTGYSDCANDVLLWYANDVGKTANFDDFKAFGCWTVPSVKQFDYVSHKDVYAVGTMLNAADAVQEDGKIYVGGFIRGNQ